MISNVADNTPVGNANTVGVGISGVSDNNSVLSTPTTEGPSSHPDTDEDIYERDLKNMLNMLPQQQQQQNASFAFDARSGDVSPVFSAGVSPSPTSQPEVQNSSERIRGGSDSSMMRSQSMPFKSDISKMMPSSAAVHDTFANVKKWSVSTFKSTKQAVNEKLGRASRTVDIDLEKKIEILRNSQADYIELLALTTKLLNQFAGLLAIQKSMSMMFLDLSVKQTELAEDFRRNAECQKAIVAHGEYLLKSLDQFKSSLETLVGQTIEDSLTTVREYEAARLRFDSYRMDYENLTTVPQAHATINHLQNVRDAYETHKTAYERLAEDVRIKLRFLDDNRVRVMHKQLMFFHNAVAAFFAGNGQQLLSSTQYLSAPDEQQETSKGLQSWLEKDRSLPGAH